MTVYEGKNTSIPSGIVRQKLTTSINMGFQGLQIEKGIQIEMNTR
jgi:hypothetical protein